MCSSCLANDLSTAEELPPDIDSIISGNALELSLDSVSGKSSLCKATSVVLPSQPQLDCTNGLSAIKQRTNQMLDVFSAHNQQFRGGVLDLVSDAELGTPTNSQFRKYLGKSHDKLAVTLDIALTDPKSLDPDELVGRFNRDRDEDLAMVKTVLPPDKHPMINLAHRCKGSTVAYGFLHYPPRGTPQHDGHCMGYNEACIRLVAQSLPRAVHHEYYKTKSTEIYEDKIKVNDLAALTAKKSDKDSDMTDQVRVQLNDAIEIVPSRHLT